MKKILATVLCASMLMLALPAFAWAANSPTNNQVSFTTSSGVGVVGTLQTGNLALSNPANNASNTPPLTGNQFVAASVMASADDNGSPVIGPDNPLTLTFSIGSQYAGNKAQVYIEYNDGTTEVVTGTVAADGTLTVNSTKAATSATFTVVVDPGSASGIISDAKSVSPQTGIDTTTVAGVSIAMALAAGCVAIALRKKVSE